MATITTRIYPQLNENLEDVSFQTGIPKSSLILYAVNETLRKNNKVEEFECISDKENIRFTLRMPEHLKLLLEETSKDTNISINSLINSCVHSFYVLNWTSYTR